MANDTIEGKLEAVIERVDPYLAHLLKYFRFGHLPEHLADISVHFCTLAIITVDPEGKHALSGPEATAMLRKLLEAKDCAVRAKLP